MCFLLSSVISIFCNNNHDKPRQRNNNATNSNGRLNYNKHPFNDSHNDSFSNSNNDSFNNNDWKHKRSYNYQSSAPTR